MILSYFLTLLYFDLLIISRGNSNPGLGRDLLKLAIEAEATGDKGDLT